MQPLRGNGSTHLKANRAASSLQGPGNRYRRHGRPFEPIHHCRLGQEPHGGAALFLSCRKRIGCSEGKGRRPRFIGGGEQDVDCGWKPHLLTASFEAPYPSLSKKWRPLRGGTIIAPTSRPPWKPVHRHRPECHHRLVYCVTDHDSATRKWRNSIAFAIKWSGRQDSNLRPPGPKPGALPACATPRRTRP